MRRIRKAVIGTCLVVLGGFFSDETARAAFVWSGNANSDNTAALDSTHRVRKKHIDEIIQNLLLLYAANATCIPFTPTFGPGTIHADLVWNGTSTAIQTGTTPIRASHIADLQTAVNALYALMHAGASCPGMSAPPAAATEVKAVYINELRACLDDMQENPLPCAPAPRCGNGVVEPGEQCDNDISPVGTPPNGNDGCSAACQDVAATYWFCNNNGSNCDGVFYNSLNDCLSAHPGKFCFVDQAACVTDASSNGCPGSGAGELMGFCGSNVGINQCQPGERAFMNPSNGAVHCVTDVTCGGACSYTGLVDTGVCCGPIGLNYTIKTMSAFGGPSCTATSVCSPGFLPNSCAAYCDYSLPPTIDPASCGPIFGCPVGYCKYGYWGGGGAGYCNMGCLQTTKCMYGPPVLSTCSCDPTKCLYPNFACEAGSPTACADGVSTSNATDPFEKCFTPNQVWSAGGNAGPAPMGFGCV